MEWEICSRFLFVIFIWLTDNNCPPENRPQTRDKHSKQHLKKKLSCSDVSWKEQMLLHANSKVRHVRLTCQMLHVSSNAPTRSTSSLARLITQWVCFVLGRCTCHHMLRIRSCIFSFGMHISSWSGIWHMTLIRGMNHGWNRVFVMICVQKQQIWTPIFSCSNNCPQLFLCWFFCQMMIDNSCVCQCWQCEKALCIRCCDWTKSSNIPFLMCCSFALKENLFRLVDNKMQWKTEKG